MSIKKWVTGLAALFAMILIVTTQGSLNVFAEQPVETAKPIEVELGDDYFKPKAITIQNGTTTTLLLKNTGRKEHTFTVEKLGIDFEVEPGKEKTITVAPKQPGTYDLICRYHAQQGMVGKVIVE